MARGVNVSLQPRKKGRMSIQLSGKGKEKQISPYDWELAEGEISLVADKTTILTVSGVRIGAKGGTTISSMLQRMPILVKLSFEGALFTEEASLRTILTPLQSLKSFSTAGDTFGSAEVNFMMVSFPPSSGTVVGKFLENTHVDKPKVMNFSGSKLGKQARDIFCAVMRYKRPRAIQYDFSYTDISSDDTWKVFKEMNPKGKKWSTFSSPGSYLTPNFLLFSGNHVSNQALRYLVSEEVALQMEAELCAGLRDESWEYKQDIYKLYVSLLGKIYMCRKDGLIVCPACGKELDYTYDLRSRRYFDCEYDESHHKFKCNRCCFSYSKTSDDNIFG